MASKMEEPDIIINGHILNPGQAMTIRVALQSFLMELHDRGLGDDDTGKQITKGYQTCGAEINRMMAEPT